MEEVRPVREYQSLMPNESTWKTRGPDSSISIYVEILGWIEDMSRQMEIWSQGIPWRSSEKKLQLVRSADSRQ